MTKIVSVIRPRRRSFLATHPSRRRFHVRSPVRIAAGIVMAAALAPLPNGAVLAQVIDAQMWITNGHVIAVARDGGTIYIGGNFTHVGPATGAAVPIDAASGLPPPSFPKVVGVVSAVAPDGAGGWYIGGFFTAVGGLPRSNLAHVASDLSVSAWNPGANDAVHDLAVSGTTLFVSGRFTSIGGQARNRIAALDVATGAATAWNPDANEIVGTLAVSGSTVYAVGSFTSIGGQARSYIAALDAATGAATAWNPAPDNEVYGVAVSGSTVYVGGAFIGIGGQTRPRIAGLDAATGAATAWNPGANDVVSDLAVSGPTVYVRGTFTSIGGQSRFSIAALDALTGMATAWDPQPNDFVSSLAVSGPLVYVGGLFTQIGGQARFGLAALDAATASATPWSPSCDGEVNELAVSGSTVYAGGRFGSIGGVPRSCIAALDAASGMATAWNPGSSANVHALAVSGAVVYAGGHFTSIGGQPRNRIAALDAATGAATAWDPDAHGGVFYSPSVSALAVSGSTIYVGGLFTEIGGQTRNRIAAIDATTGAATAWNPDAQGGPFGPDVQALVVSGSIVYAGGTFTSIGGQARNGIAALDAATGAATAWNPNAQPDFYGPSVFALAVSGSTVYAGGGFTHIGGQPRNRIAALDATSGLATFWNPNANVDVYALAVSGSTVYAGGGFTTIGGQARSKIAALDATSGVATTWNAGAAEGLVSGLAVSGSVVYAGGNLVVGGLHYHFAAIGDAPTPVLLSLVSARAEPDRVELAWLAPARDVPSATLYRRTLGDDWREIERIWTDGTGRLSFQDRQITAGTRYGYRLGVIEAGREVFLGEVWVDVPSTLDLALAIGTNPAWDDFRVTLTLPDAAPARLELFDAGGRRIATSEVGALGAGRHNVTIGEARRLAPGVYLFRLTRGARSLTARAVILR
jgi:hypothetical protein